MTAVSGGGGHDRLQDPVRIIHKDQEVISAFCINSVSLFIFPYFYWKFINIKNFYL